MAIRIPWDEYEVALLIDACNQVLDKKKTKPDMVRKLSKDLRERAKLKEIEIDEIFRNENGMSLQMTKMDYLLTDGRIGLPGASKLYAEIANLSKTQPERFAMLLDEAKKQIEVECDRVNMNGKENFRRWLSANPIKKFNPETIIQALDDGSNYCKEHSICKEGFWEITDPRKFTAVATKLLGMRIFRLTHRATASILDKAIPLYKEFLKTKEFRAVNTYFDDASLSVSGVEEVSQTFPDAIYGGTDLQHSKDEKEKLYQKLYSISRVYDNPSGISVEKIVSMLGNETNSQLVIDILDEASWSRKISETIYSFSEKPELVLREPVSSYESKSRDCITDTAFAKYLREEEGLAEATVRSYVSAIRTAEEYAREHHYICYRLYNCSSQDAMNVIHSLLSDKEFIEYNATQHNRYTSAFAKFSAFADRSGLIKTPSVSHLLKSEPIDFDKEKFIETLMRRYRNGIQFDSIDLENFRDMYDMFYDSELPFDDTALEERLRLCGVEYNGRLFPAEGIIDNETKEKLFEYIDGSFASGKKVLYYKAIFEELTDVFASCFSLRDENMLRAFIEYSAQRDKYYFFSNYMSIEQNVEIDHNAEIADYYLACGKPVNTDSVYAALSHIPQDQVSRIIVTDNHFLRNAKGEYFHRDIFEISDIEIEKIAGIIKSFIDENEYAIWTDVWDEIQDKMPVFLENNLYLSGLGIRNALEQYFVGRFNFEAAVISSPKDQFAMRDIYQLYAEHHVQFTADEIYNLSKDLDTVIYFDALSEISVRVNHDLFVSKEQICFDIDAVDKAIGSFMAKDYIRIREIDSFLAFPNSGYEWNEYLLESYLLSYSKKYKLLNNGLSLNNVAGAIVKKGSHFDGFVDVCAAVLADSFIPLKKAEALNYLADVNMISRRSYKDIDLAITKAVQIQGKKD